MISRELAARIAADSLNLSRSSHGIFTVGKVVTVDEIAYRRPILYLSGGVGLDDCWIVYLKPTNPTGLCSSTIMLISRVTGEEVYFGSANDEG